MKQVARKDKPKKVTITDVANLAEVSKASISRYLSGKHDILAEQTRKRIEDAIKELDYRPNQMARGLKGNRSNLIGMVMADITNPFSTAILRGAEDVCKDNDYSILVCNTDNDPIKERDYIFMLQSHRIDGLIIATTGHNNEFLYELACDHTPIVLVDRKVPELEFDTIVVNNEKGTSEGINFLLKRGYNHIGFFSEPIDGISSRYERLATFRNIINQLGDSDVHGEEYEIDFHNADQVDKKLDLFLSNSKGRANAIFAANGVVMLKLILALQVRGLKIPDDIAVAGFDNLDWTPAIGSGITTIAQPTYDLGVIAMERVLKRIKGDKSSSQKIELMPKLIVRGSTPLKKK